MQLASINESGLLELNTKTFEHVKETFPARIKWVVVFGVGRSGKSTLCNLISKTREFSTADITEPCTFGVWISNPIPLDDSDEYLVVVDSEGTDIGDTKYQHKILAFACLLACNGGVLIHNEKHFANSNISPLAVLASTMELLKGLEQEQFPHLCFLVRNFDFKITVNKVEVEPDEFFRHILKDVGDSMDAQRQLICRNFPNRTMFTTSPIYGKEQRHIDAHNTPPPNSDFADDFDKLLTWLLAEVQIRKVGGAVCDIAALAAFLEVCVNAINEGGSVEIPSVVEVVMDSICSRRADAALKSYNDKMAQVENILELDDVALLEVHTKNLQEAEQLYQQSTEGYFQKSVDRFKPKLKQDIEEAFKGTQTRVEADREQKQKQAEDLRRQAEANKKNTNGCEHDFSVVRMEPTYDYAHHQKWGGFLHGHRCCGRCRGGFRCNKDCDGKCGYPRIIGEKPAYYCKKCFQKM